jgi:hypothetical protein
MVQPLNLRSWVRHVVGGHSARRASRRQKHGVELLEERQLLDATPVVPAGVADSPSARFVTGLYKDLLHRMPQPAEVAGWVNVLAAGNSRDQLAGQFVSSLEYRNELISANYQRTLGRPATPQETSDWLRRASQGMDERQNTAAFLTSQAYTSNQASDSRTWLTTVYEDILGRQPERTGAEYWLNELNAGVPREQVALGIVNSVEANTRVVVSAYRNILGRSPDASGLSSFVAALDQGLTPSGLKTMLVSSPEYLDRQISAVQTVGAPNVASEPQLPTLSTGWDDIPDFGAEPTIVSIASGSWSDPRIWSAGRLPGDGDVVAISTDTTVIYDVVSDAHVNTVSIEAGGDLRFRTDTDTQIIVGNFLVKPDGNLEVGTESDPVAANVTAKVIIANQPVDLSVDPMQYGTGLIGLGNVTMYGEQKTGFVRLAVEPVAGDTTLILDQPVAGWHRGDQLVLPDTRQLEWNEWGWNYNPQWEEVEIQDISPDGRVVVLTEPLAFDHLGARNEVSGTLQFLPHVMNRTRNVVIESEDCDARGYTMFTDRADVDIRYVGFNMLGRTTTDDVDDTQFDPVTGKVNHIGSNQEGRYPLFVNHLIGPADSPKDGYQFTLVGNVIDGSGGEEMEYSWKWGIDILGSSYGLVQDNVLYQMGGAGIVTEDGSESYNVIEHNMVVAVSGTGLREDYGALAGSGFWFRGPNNYVRDNVAADMSPGGYSYGFNYFTYFAGWRTIPNRPGVDPGEDGQSINLNDTPILEFSGNEVYGASPNGLSLWWIGTFYTDPYSDAQESTVKDLSVWNVFSLGIFVYPTNRLTIDGFVLRGSASRSTGEQTGILFGDYSSYNSVIKNSDIQSMQNGIVRSSTGTDLTVEDSYLRNEFDIVIGTPFSVNGSRWLPAEMTIIRNVVFDALEGMPLVAIDMRYLDHFWETGANVIQSDQVFVYDFQGQAGDNFQVFFREQDPEFIVPQSTDGSFGLVGSPASGLTNRQNWARYGIAVAGALAPATATDRDGINGYVNAF